MAAYVLRAVYWAADKKKETWKHNTLNNERTSTVTFVMLIKTRNDVKLISRQLMHFLLHLNNNAKCSTILAFERLKPFLPLA